MTWQTVTILLDRSGNVIEELRKRPDSPDYSYRLLFSYDNSGRKVECEIYERGTTLTDKRHTRYSEDEKGNQTAAVTVFDGGLLNQAVFNTYDKAGRLVQKLWISTDGTALKTVYDSEGKQIKDTWYDRHGRGIREEIVYRYDDRGREVETIGYEAEGVVTSRCSTAYLSDTGIEETCEFDSPPERMVRTSDVDRAGNWVRSRMHVWDSTRQSEEYEVVIEREITYY